MCELTARHGRGTAWARHGKGMGTAWAWHAMCESALSVCPKSHEDICLSLGSIYTTLTMQARHTLLIDVLHRHKHTNRDTDSSVTQLG